MRKSLDGVGRRAVRKSISISGQVENILKEMSLATDGSLSQAEIISYMLDYLLKQDNFIHYFEDNFVDRENYSLLIMYSLSSNKRVIRASRNK